VINPPDADIAAAGEPSETTSKPAAPTREPQMSSSAEIDSPIAMSEPGAEAPPDLSDRPPAVEAPVNAARPRDSTDDSPQAAAEKQPSVKSPDSGTARSPGEPDRRVAPATNIAVDPESEPHSDKKVDSESSELVLAVNAAQKILDRLANADRGDANATRLLQRDTYIAVARVGAVATTDTESVRGVLRRVKDSRDLELWGQNTSAWLNLKKRPTEGILLVGKPRTDTSGQRIFLGDDQVIALTDDSKQLPKSERVLGLGRIIQTGPAQTVSLVAVEPLP
jgi:hypothetical protein